MSARATKIRVLSGRSVRQIAADELPQELALLRRDDTPATWIHADPGPAVIQALDDWGLNEIAVKSLRDGPERPRVEEFPDHLYISLFSAEKPVARKKAAAPLTSSDGEAGATLAGLRELRLFLTDKWIVSVGHISAADYDMLAERIGRQVFARGRGPSFVAYHLCEWLIESLQPIVDAIDDRIDGLEDQVVLTTGETSMQELFALKRDLVELRRRVSPLRDVMQRLGSHGVLFVEPESEVYFRDVHDDVMRTLELLDTYRDILSSALDLHLSSVSNRLNRVMKQLTVVATAFMPLSFIAGLFGTNFTRMPFDSLLWFIAMFVLMFISVVVVVFYSRRWT